MRSSRYEYSTTELTLSRANDWIHGIRSAEPEKDTKRSLAAEPLLEGERLRIIHRLITNDQSEGGAGITPKEGDWENVESIFALHDYQYNKEWIKRWSTKWLLDAQDLDEIRNRLGESVRIQEPRSRTMANSCPRSLSTLHSRSPTLPFSRYQPRSASPHGCSMESSL